MMLVVGLLVLAAMGDGTFRLLARCGVFRDPRGGPAALSTEERIGLRVCLATAVSCGLCVLFDAAGIPIGRVSLAVAAVLLESAALPWAKFLARAGTSAETSALPGAGVFPQRDDSSGADVRPAESAASLRNRLLRAPAATVLAAASASLVLFSFVHVSLVPVRTYDAIVGYDLVGRILAREGRIVSSIFTKLYFNAQCVYAPFTATSDGYWYLFSPSTPELWVPLLAGGFILLLAGWVRRTTGSPTAAWLVTFLTFLPTSLAFELTVGQTDLPSMVFVTAALFFVVDWFRGRLRPAPAAIFLFLASLARSENLLFALALAAIAFFRRHGERRRVGWLVLGPALFFAYWNLYVVRERMGYNPAAHFRHGVDLDPARALEVVRRAGEIVARPEYFGDVVWLFLLLPIAWVVGRRGLRRGVDFDTTGWLLLLLATMFVFYLPYFYMWDPTLNPLWSMQDTFKRGFFRFIPGGLAAMAASPGVLRGLRVCEGGSPGRGRAPDRETEPPSAG